VSPRAKAKIRQWFAKERREEALESGKESIARRSAAADFRCSAW
jgi:GTP pyrophosphokinase